MSGLCAMLSVLAALQLVPEPKPQAVFAGDLRPIRLAWRNEGETPVRVEIRARLLQATSATAAPIGETPWKTLQLLPHQTVLETAAIAFPAVNSATRFIVQWLAGETSVLGTTDVVVYPPNLLHELSRLVGQDALAVLDPDDVIKPALEVAAVAFSDLADLGTENFPGRLVLVASPMFGVAQARTLAKQNVAVVWIQLTRPARSASQSDEPLRPSFFVVRTGKVGIVVAQPALVADLAASPSAQLALLALARLALNPAPHPWPTAETSRQASFDAHGVQPNATVEHDDAIAARLVPLLGQ